MALPSSKGCACSSRVCVCQDRYVVVQDASQWEPVCAKMVRGQADRRRNTPVLVTGPQLL